MTNPLIQKPLDLSKLKNHQSNSFVLTDFIHNTLFWLPKEVVLAGGACRNIIKKEPINDFDLFFTGDEETQQLAFNEAKLYFQEKVARYKKIFECKEGKLVTFFDELTSLKIQLVKEEVYSGVESVLNRFDFNAARFAIQHDKADNIFWFYYSRQSIKDVKAKTLSLFNLIFPVSTIKRAYKYQNKGYQINDCLTSIVRTVNNPEMQFTEDEIKRVYID